MSKGYPQLPIATVDKTRLASGRFESMLSFIKRLFGTRPARDESLRSGAVDLVVEHTFRSDKPRVTDAYFDTMTRMQDAVSERNFEEAARLVRENLKYISDWVKETRRDYGSFDISTIPGLQQGGKVLALVGDDEGLVRMTEIVASVAELEPWIEEVKQHQHDRRLFQAILELVAAQPNCRQTDVKGLVGRSRRASSCEPHLISRQGRKDRPYQIGPHV